MFINKENLTNKEYLEEKKSIESITVKLNQHKAGIIVAETNDGFINFGMFGNAINIIYLIRILFEKLPANLRIHALNILNEAKYAESDSLETQAPTHNRSYN